jgi:peroxiredoxin Q/BCP
MTKKGDNAPNFLGIDQDGKEHKLDDYKGKS